MSKPLFTVKRDVLELPPLDRAQLLEEIYRSLENEEIQKRTEAWAREAESRIDAYEQAQIESRSYDEVRKSML